MRALMTTLSSLPQLPRIPMRVAVVVKILQASFSAFDLSRISDLFHHRVVSLIMIRFPVVRSTNVYYFVRVLSRFYVKLMGNSRELGRTVPRRS